LIVDAPGERTWSLLPTTAPHDEPTSEETAHADAANAQHTTLEDPPFDETRARLDAMRYGGADGAQPLPEIDLHADLAPDDES